MQTNTLKSQKTSSGLGNFHVNNWEDRRKIRTNTLYLVSYHLQRSNQGPAGFKKQSQYNESSFCLLTRPQDLKN